jgi:hypothetical protein
VAAYTGTRTAAIGAAGFVPSTENGWIDLRTGRFYRAAEGAVETKKRQPTVVIPRRLLMHIRRWKKANPTMKWVVEYRGKPVAEVNKGFAAWSTIAASDRRWCRTRCATHVRRGSPSVALAWATRRPSSA